MQAASRTCLCPMHSHHHVSRSVSSASVAGLSVDRMCRAADKSWWMPSTLTG
ncbi:hypothetical protein SGRIM128S_02223 [Streptomyces griseomycini]